MCVEMRQFIACITLIHALSIVWFYLELCCGTAELLAFCFRFHRPSYDLPQQYIHLRATGSVGAPFGFLARVWIDPAVSELFPVLCDVCGGVAIVFGADSL